MNAAPEIADALDTPVMRQYLEIKRAYPDCILFFRMGDFYEMFLDDAVRAAPVLDVALTRRQNAIPMAGVPYHSVDTYLARAIAAGTLETIRIPAERMVSRVGTHSVDSSFMATPFCRWPDYGICRFAGLPRGRWRR